MRFLSGIAALALTIVAICQKRPASQQSNTAQWLNIDQLCGTLQFATPKKKTIRTADSKTETLLYADVLKDADVALYMGAASDQNCCGAKTPAGHTKSTKSGRFELCGFQSGWYWLRVESNGFNATIPLHVTEDFDDKSCHAPFVGRIFTVDAQPPKVETRIY